MPAAPRTTLLSFAALLGCAALAGLGAWLIDQPARVAGVDELVPREHRPAPGSHLLVTLRGAAAADSWPQVVDQLGPLLPGHFPLAPPPAEARAWLDAHILYRIPPERHAALAARLEPAALRAAVAGIRARLASPLFGVSDEQPRRDPLDLRALGADEPGFLAPGAGPIPTASGDLLSADGRSLLLYLRTALPPARLHAWAAAQLFARFGVDSGIEVGVLPITSLAAVDDRSRLRLRDLLAATFAALTLALALGLRRSRAALVLTLIVAAPLPLVVLLAGDLQGPELPLLLALPGLALALAPGVGDHGPGPGLRLALALTPLLLLPYPLWQRWAWVWLLALPVLVAAARVLGPALLRLGRAPAAPDPRPRRGWPPLVGLALCAALLAVGTWSSRQAAAVDYSLGAGDADLAADFFAPSRLAELRSVGPDEPAALAAAVADAARLTALGPEIAERVDTPGSYLLGEAEAGARQAALAALDLPGRIELLRVALTEVGLRPDAFGEFIRALDPNRQPTPEAALAGPLAGWLRTRLAPDPAGVAAVGRVLLAAELPVGRALPSGLRGPAVFAHQELQARDARLGLALAASAWLSAFLTWLAARRLAPALSAALVGLAAQAGALALVVAAGGVGLALLLPALLLVGAAAAEGAARACAPPVPGDSHGRPALALACLLAPAVVLLASPEPAWRSFALVLGFGAVLGFVLATRAAPRLCALLARLIREEPRP